MGSVAVFVGDGRPSTEKIRLMEEMRLTSFFLVVYAIIYRNSYIPGGARFQPSTVGIVIMGI